MNIGLIAHDGKKKLMQNFCIAYRGILNKHELFATATTGRLIEEVTNLTIHKYLAGPLGGEQQTDFIFSVVGEETGFIGSVIVIALLAIIMIECFKTAYVAKNMSGRLIAVGMAALIGFQSFINIGVATELLPNTGLPLPFVSYGLTSLLSYMAGIGIVLNIGLQRHY